MSDEAKRYPPSERKLARLWQAGATSASPALVAVAVIVTSGLLLALAGPTALGWMSGWIRTGLQAAGQPETALGAVRGIALRGGLMAAGVALIALATALAAQAAQMGSRDDATPSDSARRDRPRALQLDGWRIARAVMLTAVAGVVVAATLRAALVGVSDVFDLARPMEMFISPGRSVGGALLIVLIGVAVLDAIYERTVWLRGAWMTRREVEEETRETHGHPLTRERRSVASRRRTDA